MPGRIGALLVKELLAVLRDRRSRLILIVPPIIQLILFSYAATLEVVNVSVGVMNRDGGRWSAEFVQRLEGSPTFTRIVPLADEAAVREAIDMRRVIAVVRFPQHFSRDVVAGRPAQVQVILDGRRSNAAQIVLGYLRTVGAGIGAQIIAEAPGDEPPGAVTVPRAWFNPNLLYQWFTLPSLIGTLTMVVALIVTGQSVARERELGTFDQLLVSPLRPHEILIGKAIPPLLVGLVQGTLFAIAAVVIFGVPFRGSLVLFYASLVLFLLAVVGIGLFISAISRTQQQAFLGAFLFMAPAVLLSGFAAPIENMPAWLQVGTLANPLRHFMVLVKGIFLKAMPADVALASAVPLAIIAVVTLVGATWLFTRRLE